MASPHEEYTKAWHAICRIDVLCEELSNKKFEGRFGEARRERYEAEIAVKKRFLTPPAKQGALNWQTRVLKEVRAVQQSRLKEGKQLPAFGELRAAVLKLPALPDPETVVRYLNRMGYYGNRGRPKKR